MNPPTLQLLPGTRGASTCFPPRYDPLQDGPHGPSHPGQISRHVPDFPIYSNGTNLEHFTDTLAEFVRGAQRNLSQPRAADNPDELLGRPHAGDGNALVSAALVLDIYSSDLFCRGADHRGNQVDAALAQLL